MLDVVQIPLGPYRTNCYLVAREGASEAVVIDPGDDSGTVLSVLAERGWTPTAVLVTHGHSDHLGAVRDVAEASGIEVWIPHDEADDLRTLDPGGYEPDHLLEGGETVSAAGIDFDTMLVPGHSPASIAYHADSHLFSGDVLFAGSVGRTDLAGGDTGTLVASIGRLVDAYPADTIVLPGHGPATTLAAERAANPFLGALRA
jgi:hydroxyacylglutathione hydrolase